MIWRGFYSLKDAKKPTSEGVLKLNFRGSHGWGGVVVRAVNKKSESSVAAKGDPLHEYGLKKSTSAGPVPGRGQKQKE